MYIIKPLSLFGALTMAFAASAIEVNITAGDLKNAQIPADETSLTVSGTMNAADFAYIFDNLNSLASLDLSAAQIVAYQGEVLKYTGMNNSPANTLPAYSLTGMANLKSITLPASLTVIGKGALSGSGITALVIPSKVTEIQDYALMRCPDLQRVVIPSSVTIIGTRALAYCPKLDQVEMTASLSALPEGLFEACDGLKTLSLDELSNCTEIGQWALADCNGITTLVLPEGTSIIDKAALYGTAGLSTMVLPASLSYIGDVAMANMTDLSELNVAAVNTVPNLGENVWSGVDQSKVKLITPEGGQDAYRNAEQWNQFDIVQQSSTQSVSSSVGGGTLYVKVDGDVLSVTSGSDALGRVSVFDPAGRNVASAQGKNVVKINIVSWPKGVYLVVSQQGVCKVSL